MDNTQYLIEMRNKLIDEYKYYLQNGYDDLEYFKNKIEEIDKQIYLTMNITQMTPTHFLSKEEIVRQDRERKLNRICDDEHI